MKTLNLKFIFLIVFFIFSLMIIQSCQKDIDIADQNFSVSENKSLKSNNNFNYWGLSHNGEYFCVSSKSRLNQIISDLDSKIAGVTNQNESLKSAIPDDMDESDYILDQFTQSHNHESKWKVYTADVNHQLSKINVSSKAPGIPNNPSDALNKVADLGLDDVELALVSESGYLCVGGNLYYYGENGVVIKLKYKTPYMIDYMKRVGLKKALHFYRGYMQVVERPSIGDLVSFDRECTAEFSAIPTADKDDLKVSFTWLQMAAANLYPNATLTWNFGDGSSTVTQKSGESSFGEVSHEYTVKGTYRVQLTINAPAEKDEVRCYKTFAEDVSVEKSGQFDWEDVKDIVCISGQAISLFDRDAFVRYSPVTGGDEGQYLLSPSFLADISETAINIINAGQAPIRNVNWTFNGQNVGSGLQVQVTVPCTGSFDGTISYTCDGTDLSIQFTITIEDQNLIRDIKTDWIDRDLTSGKKASFKLKTKSKNPDNAFGGTNKLVVKGKHFKQKSNGNWKKEKADYNITMGGSLVQTTSNGCFNGPTRSVNESISKSNKKKFKEVYKNNYASWSALSIDVSDAPRVWYIEGTVNNTNFARISAND